MTMPRRSRERALADPKSSKGLWWHMRKLLFTAAALLACAAPALAQDDWPSRPIKLIVPFAAGGNTDSVARITASHLQQALGVGIVIENRGGAGGIIGTDAVTKAAPDGTTFCVCSIG